MSEKHNADEDGKRPGEWGEVLRRDRRKGIVVATVLGAILLFLIVGLSFASSSSSPAESSFFDHPRGWQVRCADSNGNPGYAPRPGAALHPGGIGSMPIEEEEEELDECFSGGCSCGTRHGDRIKRRGGNYHSCDCCSHGQSYRRRRPNQPRRAESPVAVALRGTSFGGDIEVGNPDRVKVISASVAATVVGFYSSTTISLTYSNTSDSPVTSTWSFVLPAGAVAQSLSIDGCAIEPVDGERRVRGDFSLGAGATVDVAVSYEQELDFVDGRLEYILLPSAALDKAAISVTVPGGIDCGTSPACDASEAGGEFFFASVLSVGEAFVVSRPVSGAIAVAGESGRYRIMVPFATGNAAKAEAGAVAVILDVSRSGGGEGYARRIEAFEETALSLRPSVGEFVLVLAGVASAKSSLLTVTNTREGIARALAEIGKAIPFGSADPDEAFGQFAADPGACTELIAIFDGGTACDEAGAEWEAILSSGGSRLSILKASSCEPELVLRRSSALDSADWFGPGDIALAIHRGRPSLLRVTNAVVAGSSAASAYPFAVSGSRILVDGFGGVEEGDLVEITHYSAEGASVLRVPVTSVFVR
ncbi:MAG: hypothetical protein WC712_03100 [Candidatus Brocadiia bacterium]